MSCRFWRRKQRTSSWFNLSLHFRTIAPCTWWIPLLMGSRSRRSSTTTPWTKTRPSILYLGSLTSSRNRTSKNSPSPSSPPTTSSSTGKLETWSCSNSLTLCPSTPTIPPAWLHHWIATPRPKFYSWIGYLLSLTTTALASSCTILWRIK